MITALLFAAAMGSAGDPIDSRYAPFMQDGCIEGPPVPAFDSEQDVRSEQPARLEDMPMSGQSIRFIISPDSFRDEGLLMVQIDSGLRRSLGADGQPFVLATVGNWRRTCTVRMPLEACPEAARVRDQLQQLQIPIGYGFSQLDRITLHATRYSLQFYGEGKNQLSYSGPGNPLQDPLERARAALQACWQPAFDAAVADQADW